MNSKIQNKFDKIQFQILFVFRSHQAMEINQTIIFKYENSFRFIKFLRHNRLRNFCVKLTMLKLTTPKNI